MVLMMQHLNSVYAITWKLLVNDKTCHVLAIVKHQVALLSQSDSCHFLPFSCADSLLRRPIFTSDPQNKNKQNYDHHILRLCCVVCMQYNI